MRKFAIGETDALKLAYTVEGQRHISTQMELLKTRGQISAQAVTGILCQVTGLKPDAVNGQGFELSDKEIIFPNLPDEKES